MSAFALRKKLLGQNIPAASPSIHEPQVAETPDAILGDTEKAITSPQKKARKNKTTRHISVERSDTPIKQTRSQPSGGPAELPALSISQVDQVSRGSSPFSLEDEQEDAVTSAPVPAQPIHLSSFRPSKSNYRKKSNGVSQLKLQEGEVRMFQ